LNKRISEGLEYFVEPIMEVGNNKEFIKMAEPQVSFPQELQKWMIKRVLLAYFMLQQESKIEK